MDCRRGNGGRRASNRRELGDGGRRRTSLRGGWLDGLSLTGEQHISTSQAPSYAKSEAVNRDAAALTRKLGELVLLATCTHPASQPAACAASSSPSLMSSTTAAGIVLCQHAVAALSPKLSSSPPPNQKVTAPLLAAGIVILLPLLLMRSLVLLDQCYRRDCSSHQQLVDASTSRPTQAPSDPLSPLLPTTRPAVPLVPCCLHPSTGILL